MFQQVHASLQRDWFIPSKGEKSDSSFGEKKTTTNFLKSTETQKVVL